MFHIRRKGDSNNDKKTKKKEIGPIGCPETPVNRYDTTLRNTSQERRVHHTAAEA
jgi:hypothetical protein